MKQRSLSRDFSFRVPSHGCLTERISAAVVLLGVVAMWALTHRYGGIWHDGALYAAQSLYRLNPEAFSGDLFFAYGSQDSFSVFGPLYAVLVDASGLFTAALLLAVVGQVTWLAGAFFLAVGVCGRRDGWLAILLLAVLPGIYGADEVFAYAETFVTARLFAEGLCLFSLGCLVRGKKALAVAVLLGAAAIHPVMAFPCVIVACAVLMPRRLFFFSVALGVAGVVVMAAGMLDVPPLAVMDADWYRISVARSPFVFLDQWSLAEWGEPLFWGALLFLQAQLSGKTKLSALPIAILVAATVGFFIAAVAAVFPVALLVQMQTWRAAWVLKVVAVLAVVPLVRELGRRGGAGCYFGAILFTAWFALDEEWSALLAWIMVLASDSYFRAVPRLQSFVEKHHNLDRYGSWLLAGVPLVLCLPELSLAFDMLRDDVARYGSALAKTGYLSPVFRLSPSGPLLFVLGLGVVIAGSRLSSRGSRGWLVPMVLPSVIMCIVGWAAMVIPASRVVWPAVEMPEAAVKAIPEGSVTYFENGKDLLWFHLQRASYASHHQAAGVIFSRETALQSEKRLSLLAPLGGRDAKLEWRREAAPELGRREFPASALRGLCGDSALHQVVLSDLAVITPPTMAPALSFEMRWVAERGPAVRYNLFDCREIRPEVRRNG